MRRLKNVYDSLKPGICYIKIFLGLSIILSLLIVKNPPVLGWSSFEQGFGTFGTHQFLNNQAYARLRSHPAIKFKFVDFPSIQDIQKYAGAAVTGLSNFPPSIIIVGEGPDNPKNSKFSWHYYNPTTGKGKCPEKVEYYYKFLKRNLAFKKSGLRDSFNNESPPARNAAYLAHFIQDMGCSFHVLGMPRIGGGKIGQKTPPGPQVWGPYRDFNQDFWAKVCERAETDNDKNTDWFDPNYYDGSWPISVKGSTHFSYEALIELVWKENLLRNTKKWASYKERNGYVSGLWENTRPETQPQNIRNFAKEMSKETRQRVEERKSGLWFDSAEYQKDLLEKGFDNILEWRGPTTKIKKIYRDVTGKYVKVPFEDWWRSVQATYTVWRASFSALVIAKDAIELRQEPDNPNIYRVIVSVANMEPEGAAWNINVRYKVKGGSPGSGHAKVGSLDRYPEKDSKTGWIQLSGQIRIEDPENIPGTISLEVTGRYDNTIPDAGITAVKLPLEDLKLVRRPHLVRVPGVVGKPLGLAKRLINKHGLNASVTERLAESIGSEGIVIYQYPKKDWLRPRGSDIIILVIKSLPQSRSMDTPTDQQSQGGQQQREDDNFFGKYETGIPLRELLVKPDQANLSVNSSLNLTAIPIDVYGNALTGEKLKSLKYEWIVNDPFMAHIDGSGPKAVISPRKEGEVLAICITPQVMGYATIKVKKIEEPESLSCPSKVPKDAKQYKGLNFEYWKMPNGKYVGPYRKWYDNNKTKPSLLKCYDTQGMLYGPVIRWFKNGEKSLYENYKEGRLDGLCKSWHEDPYGPKWVTEWKDGKRHGIYKSIKKDGKPITEEIYKDGKLVKWIQYDADGKAKIEKEGTFRGHQIQDGTVVKKLPSGAVEIETWSKGKRVNVSK